MASSGFGARIEVVAKEATRSVGCADRAVVVASQEDAQISARWAVLRTSETRGPQHEQQQRWVVSSGVRVGAAVVLQVPGLAELSGAQVALEGPDARVDLDVPVAVTVARKRLAAHAAAEGPVLEVLCLVQAVLEPVTAREVAVAARVAAVPHGGPAVATVAP